MNEQKALYKYDWDFGRMGKLSGLFLALPSQVEAAIGKTFYFGEVLGKHSEIAGTIDPGDIELVTVQADDVQIFERLFLKDDISGRNPLKYLRGDYECESCGCWYDSDEEAKRCCQEERKNK